MKLIMENWRKLLKEEAEKTSLNESYAYSDSELYGRSADDQYKMVYGKPRPEKSPKDAEPNDTDGDGFTDAKLDEKSFDVLSKLAKALSGQRVPFEAEDGETFLAAMETLGISRKALLK